MLASIALGADNPLGATTAKTIWRYAKTMFEIKMIATMGRRKTICENCKQLQLQMSEHQDLNQGKGRV